MPVNIYCHKLSPIDKQNSFKILFCICVIALYEKVCFSVMKIPLLSLGQSYFILMLRFIPMVFRKDKCGVMINVIIRPFDIQILKGRSRAYWSY